MNSDSRTSEVPEWPEFAPSDESAKSPIPVTRVSGWEQFTDILDAPFFNRPNIDLVFRGQRRHTWGLSPSLARLDPRNIIEERTAERQLRLFRQAVRGRITDTSLVTDSERDELWSVGQHHGLQTPVLDWTASPFVALFFAFENEDSFEESEFRAVYVMNKTRLLDRTELEGEAAPVRIYEPLKDDYGRLVNQAGLFTIARYGNTFENVFIDSLADVLESLDDNSQLEEIKKHLCKILIPNMGRSECLKSLFRMNVHHASLFPDLEGSAKYCNGRVAEWLANQAVEVSGSPETGFQEVPAVEPEERLLAEFQHPFWPPEESDFMLPTDMPLTVAYVIEQAVRQTIPSPEFELDIIDEIIEKIQRAIVEKQVVDWYDRDPILAGMRTAARRIMRGFGVGPGYAEKIASDAVLAASNVARQEAEIALKKQIEDERKAPSTNDLSASEEVAPSLGDV